MRQLAALGLLNHGITCLKFRIKDALPASAHPMGCRKLGMFPGIDFGWLQNGIL